MSKFKSSIFNIKWILIILFFCNLSCSILKVQEKTNQTICLDVQTIENLLDNDVPQEKIIKEISRQGVQFELDDWRTTAKLVRAGANNTLLESIEEHHCNNMPIIIPFRSFWFYGVSDTSIIFADDGSFVVKEINSATGIYCYTFRSFNIEKRKILKIKVEGSHKCNFIKNNNPNENKMLKVHAGPTLKVLTCENKEVLSPDPNFITQKDGVFKYRISKEIICNGELQGLGLLICSGYIKNLKISAWFQY